MFDSDQQIKAHALKMWANFIETGSPILSAGDVKSRLANDPKFKDGQVKALTPDQTALVDRLRLLSAQELTEDSRQSMKTLEHDHNKYKQSPRRH